MGRDNSTPAKPLETDKKVQQPTKERWEKLLRELEEEERKRRLIRRILEKCVEKMPDAAQEEMQVLKVTFTENVFPFLDWRTNEEQKYNQQWKKSTDRKKTEEEIAFELTEKIYTYMTEIVEILSAMTGDKFCIESYQKIPIKYTENELEGKMLGFTKMQFAFTLSV